MRKMILFVITTLVLVNFLDTFVQAQCVQPPSGMVGWFPFDENTGGTTANLINSANNGILSGTTWTTGKVSNSLNFQNASVNVNNYPAINFGTGNFSIDAWIKKTSGAATVLQTIVDKRVYVAANLQGYLLFVYQGKSIGLQLASGGTFKNYFSTPVPTILDGNWHHITVTVNRTGGATGISFYFDGVFAGNANPSQVMGSLTNTEPLRIGRQGTTSAFTGAIDEVELFNRVLTPAEVTSIVAAGSFGKCKPSITPSPQPMVSISNVSSSLVLPPSTDVYFAFEHPTAKWIIVAGWDTANSKNVVKRIELNGAVTNITLPKCRTLYNNPPPGVDLPMTVRSVTFGGDLIATGQFDRCETVPYDIYPLGTPGIVKVKANGQIDIGFNPDFYPANSSMCQTVPLPGGFANRKYCPPINFQAIQAFDGNMGFSSIFLYGNFQNINGTSLPNPTNLIKLNVNNGQHDPTFMAPNISGTVKGISPQGGTTAFGVWGDFTVGITRKNLMRLEPNGTVSNQFNPGTNIDGPINTVGAEPVPFSLLAGGSFTKYKVSNYPIGSQPIKNIVFTGEDFSSNTNGYRYFSWGSVSPFEIVSMDYAKGSTSNPNVNRICAGGNSLVCFTDGYADPNGQNNRTPTATTIPVNGNVKVVFNIFGTNDFLIGGNFTNIAGNSVNGFAKITFTY